MHVQVGWEGRSTYTCMYRWSRRGGVHTHACTGGMGGAEYIHMHVLWDGRGGVHTHACTGGMGGAEYIHMHVQVGWEG